VDRPKDFVGLIDDFEIIKFGVNSLDDLDFWIKIQEDFNLVRHFDQTDSRYFSKKMVRFNKFLHRSQSCVFLRSFQIWFIYDDDDYTRDMVVITTQLELYHLGNLSRIMGPNLDNQELNFERFTLMRPFPRELVEDIFKFYKRFDDDCWIFPPEMIALKTFKLVNSNIAKDYFKIKGIISDSKIVTEHQVKIGGNNDIRLIPPEDNFLMVPDTVRKCINCSYPYSSHVISDCKKLRLEEEKEVHFKCPVSVR
jgi:hypothetical protein